MAEREGFEPSVPRKEDNGFRDRPDRPLRHLSIPTAAGLTTTSLRTASERNQRSAANRAPAPRSPRRVSDGLVSLAAESARLLRLLTIAGIVPPWCPQTAKHVLYRGVDPIIRRRARVGAQNRFGKRRKNQQ